MATGPAKAGPVSLVIKVLLLENGPFVATVCYSLWT